jgi:hypothetical protein
MSPEGGRPPGLRDIPPGAPTRRLPSEPSGHGDSHLYAYIRGEQHELGHDRRLSSADGWYLDAMAARTNRDGTMRGSLRELAKDLDRSITTVRYHVKRLIEFGFVEELGTCAEDQRHRQWRIAGMDRRDRGNAASGDNRRRGRTNSREGLSRPPLESREGGSRIWAQLPEEQIEKTRASTQQEPLSPRDWGRANDRDGIRQSREALRARGAPGAALGPPEPPPTASDGASVPEAGSGAENGTEGAAEGAA